MTPAERRLRDRQEFMRRLAELVPLLALAGVYVIAAKFGLLFAIEPGYASAVWPPSGIALAALLLFGKRLWPGVSLGALIVNLTVETSLAAALLISVGNTLEALAAAALVRRHIGTARVFVKAENVFKFAAIAAASSMIAASVAALPLAVLHGLRDLALVTNWWTWWQGDAAGIIIVTPLVMSWRSPEQAWKPARIAELAALATLLLAVTLAIFGSTASDELPRVMLPFLVLPIIVWAAFRFGQRELTASLAAVCAIAAWFTLAGQGPFARAPLNIAMLMLLAFIGTVIFTGLLLNAVLRERASAMAALGRALDNVHELALTDPLTGLYNRRLLQDALPRELILAERRDEQLAVIMIDLDYFKRINDSSGHDAGDAALVEVAALLKRHIRASDIACRYGGEEFVLVLPDATLAGAVQKAEELRVAIAQLALRHRGALGVTASLGVAVYPQHGLEAESLLRAADEALYAAKGAGRNRVIASDASPRPPLETSRRKTA